MCPHTTIQVSSYYYVCPHTTICVSSYYYICVLILPKPDGRVRGYISSDLTLLYSVQILLYVSEYYYICVLILLYVFSYYYVCCIILPDLEVSGSGEEALAAPSASVFVLLYQ
jgi:hypothetical protein